MLLFKETPKIDHLVADLLRGEEDDATQGIRCPLCAWRPSGVELWACQWVPGAPEPQFPSCGTMWHTFSTRGRCPGCSHQWQWTTCFACHEWSPHEDWYEDGNDRRRS